MTLITTHNDRSTEQNETATPPVNKIPPKVDRLAIHLHAIKETYGGNVLKT